MPGRVWSEVEEIELRQHFAAGLSYRQIARKLGYSLNAVTAKLHRLGLGRPQQQGHAMERPVLQRAGKVTLPVLASLHDPDAR